MPFRLSVVYIEAEREFLPPGFLDTPLFTRLYDPNRMAEEEDDSLDALEYELNQMGLSVEDLQPPDDGQFDRRAMARVESARIMSRRFIERDKVKSRISAQTKVRHSYWMIQGTA